MVAVCRWPALRRHALAALLPLAIIAGAGVCRAQGPGPVLQPAGPPPSQSPGLPPFQPAAAPPQGPFAPPPQGFVAPPPQSPAASPLQAPVAVAPPTAGAAPLQSPAASLPRPQDLPPPIPGSTPLVEEKVLDVRIVGNHSFKTQKILELLTTRKDRPFDQTAFEKDVRKLMGKGWFLDVRPKKEPAPGGVIVIFEVVERPTLQYVRYLGNVQIASKKLAKETDLKKGDALDPYAVEEGKRKIEAYYEQKGYSNVQVTIMEGNRVGDRGAIFLINEGNAQKIWSVKFVGNTIVDGRRLYTQIQSHKPILYLFKGYVDRKKIDEDVEKLTAYYRKLGFFRARVGRELDFDENGKWLTLTFVIDEGIRYRVRNVTFLNNTKYTTEQLSRDLKVTPGKFFDQDGMNKDVGLIRDLYGSQGYVFADVQADPRFLEEPGQLDLVYNVKEGGRYRAGRIIVHIDGESPHTRHNTVLVRTDVRPGDIIDIRKIRNSERRLGASSLFANGRDPSKGGTAPKIVFSPPDGDPDKATANRPKDRDNFRGQSPDPTPSAGRPARPVEMYVDGQLWARGEWVLDAGDPCFRVTEVIPPPRMNWLPWAK